MKRKKNYITIFTLGIIIILIAFSYIMVKDFNVPEKNYTSFTIKSGTTGEEVTIKNQEQIDTFIDKFNLTPNRLNGIGLSGMGYRYKITLSTNTSKKTFFLQTSTSIKYGVFEYKLNEDFGIWIEEFFD